MRTASHVCRVRITGYNLLYRAVGSIQLPPGRRNILLYSTKRSRSDLWRKVATSNNAQPPVAARPEHGIDYWTSRCDLFLPLELRSKTWEDNLSTFAGVRSAEHLPKVLAESCSTFPQGILTHIALTQKRWSAALFLCQALLQYENRPAPKPLIITNGSPWSTLKAAGPQVDIDFFQKPLNLQDIILFQDRQTALLQRDSLDRIARTPFIEQDEAAQLWKFAIGQIWRCIGHVMLSSTQENSPLQVDMVSFVLQVVAAMHSSGVVSDDIYLFDSNSIADNMRKSPFLHLMSSRIMTALSDVMWKKVEPDLMRDRAYVAARHAHKGSKSPAGENGPRLRQLEHEVWLELILWGCVHGEHFHTGAELLQTMFEAGRQQRWKAVPWSKLQEQLEAKLLAQQDVRKSKSWYQRLASSIEGYSEEEPYVQLGKNTVSQEVVVRLCDGMLSSSEPPFPTPIAAGTLVASCSSVLGSHPKKISELSQHSFLYRTTDYSIDNVLQLTQATEQDKHLNNVHRDSSQNGEQASVMQADPQYSLLTKTLAHHIDQRDVHKALQSYEQLKIWSGNDEYDTSAEMVSSNTTDMPLSSRIDLQFLVPAGLLAALLHLVTNSRLNQSGQSLIKPFTQNGEIVPATFQRSTALKRAILRFTGSSSDPAILEQLRGKHYPDIRLLNVEALQELLRLEIADNNWSMARKLLQTMAETRDTKAVLEEAAKIAVQIMHICLRTRPAEAYKLVELLMEILSGQYRPQRSSGEATTLQEPRQLNQLSQILISMGHRRFEVLRAHISHDGQLSNPIELPASIFNTLLEAVIDVHGISAGQEFFQKWCRASPDLESRPGDRRFRPVSPSLETLRILLRPFTSRFQQHYRHKEVFTRTGERGKDASPLEMLVGGRNNIRTLYESILGFYYRNYGADLQIIFFAMDICKAWGYDQENTFYSLLQPMERPVIESSISNESAETAAGHST